METPFGIDTGIALAFNLTVGNVPQEAERIAFPHAGYAPVTHAPDGALQNSTHGVSHGLFANADVRGDFPHQHQPAGQAWRSPDIAWPSYTKA